MRHNGQAHLSFIQLVEERSLEQGGFNPHKIEKLRILSGTFHKPLSTYSLALFGKFPTSIGLKVSNETFDKSWVIDSCANDHMTYSSHKFNKYNPCPSNRKIITTDGSLTITVGVGDV